MVTLKVPLSPAWQEPLTPPKGDLGQICEQAPSERRPLLLLLSPPNPQLLLLLAEQAGWGGGQVAKQAN